MAATFALFRKAFVILLVCIIGYNAEIAIRVVNVTVYEGQDARIPCNYETDIDASYTPIISWYVVHKNVFVRLYQFRHGDESETFQDRESVFRRLNIGDHGELIIPNATLEDNTLLGNLVCAIDLLAPGYNMSQIFGFSVAAPASTDPVTTITYDEFAANGEYQFVGTCQSGCGYPEPIVDFYRGDENSSVPIPSNHSSFGSVESTRKCGNFTAKVSKKLIIVPTGADDKAQYYCRVRSGINGEIVQNRRMPLFRVRYPTDRVKFKANKRYHPDLHGYVLTLTCKANGNPEPRIIDFGGQTSPEYRKNVSVVHDGTKIVCKAGNNLSEPVVATYTIYISEIAICGVSPRGWPIRLDDIVYAILATLGVIAAVLAVLRCKGIICRGKREVDGESQENLMDGNNQF